MNGDLSSTARIAGERFAGMGPMPGWGWDASNAQAWRRRMTAQQKWLIWGAGLSALALMVWGYIFWSLSPLPFAALKPLPDEEAVLKVFRDTQLATGVYSFPGMVEGQGMSGAFFEKTKSGPIGQIFIQREGYNPLNPLYYVGEWVHFFLVSLAAGGLLIWVRPVLPSYALRFAFVLALSAFAALTLEFSAPLWWHHAWGFHGLMALYDVGCGLVSGLVLAWALDSRRLLASPLEDSVDSEDESTPA
jgi:cytochrome b subunit of formate dehydrogenase